MGRLAATPPARGDQVEAEYIHQLIARKAARYLQTIRERDLLFPGVRELVQRLAGQFPLALVSGALRQEVEFVLARGGLREAFRVIVTAEDVRQGKPHPEGFLKGLNLLAQAGTIKPHECMVLEDSVAGVAAAKRAGMFCVAVTNSYPATALQLADVIVCGSKFLPDFFAAAASCALTASVPGKAFNAPCQSLQSRRCLHDQ